MNLLHSRRASSAGFMSMVLGAMGVDGFAISNAAPAAVAVPSSTCRGRRGEIPSRRYPFGGSTGLQTLKSTPGIHSSKNTPLRMQMCIVLYTAQSVS